MFVIDSDLGQVAAVGKPVDLGVGVVDAVFRIARLTNQGHRVDIPAIEDCRNLVDVSDGFCRHFISPEPLLENYPVGWWS
jgi:hypothetical protein